MNDAISVVATALEQYGCKRSGNDWTCPAHKGGSETKPSLSVTEGDKGVVMTCHAGCAVDEVVSALGLKTSDLFNEPIQRESKREIATYSYVDESGAKLFDVVRFEPKTFRQRLPEKVAGKWAWSIKGVRRVLYRLPRVLEAIKDGNDVWICEGEKDVAALEEHDQTATCNPGGQGKWRDEFADMLNGARHVVIVADKDDVGRAHAAAIKASLAGKVGSVEIVEAKEGKDAFDHFARGYKIDEFLPVQHTELEEPPTAPTNPMWAKLLDTNDIDSIPPPQYLIDKLLVADALTVVFGLPAAGKSFLTIDWALCIANHMKWLDHDVQGGDVLYVIAEGLSGVGKRKLAWQQERRVLMPKGVKWYPEPVNLLDKVAVGHLLEIACDLQPLAIFVDTLARSIPGADENAPGPMSEAIEVLDTMRRECKASVVMNHHTPKDGSTPRGHSGLLGAVQTAIKVSNVEGDITLAVEKQKDDEPITMNLRLRKVNDSAVLYRSLGTDNTVTSFADLQLLSAIREHTAPGEGIAVSTLMRLSGIPEATIHRAKTRLAAQGRIYNVGTERQPRWAISGPHIYVPDTDD